MKVASSPTLPTISHFNVHNIGIICTSLNTIAVLYIGSALKSGLVQFFSFFEKTETGTGLYIFARPK